MAVARLGSVASSTQRATPSACRRRSPNSPLDRGNRLSLKPMRLSQTTRAVDSTDFVEKVTRRWGGDEQGRRSGSAPATEERVSQRVSDIGVAVVGDGLAGGDDLVDPVEDVSV